MTRSMWIQFVTLGVLGVLVAAPTRAGALEAAAARELELLARERAELLRTKEEIEAQRSARAGALRATIAQREAELVTALAAEKQVEDELARVTAHPPRSPEDEQALARVLRAAQGLARGETIETLEAALGVGLGRARAGVTVEKIDTGFFSPDGTFVDGAVLTLGTVAAVAASGSSAGPAWRVGGGAFEVASADPIAAEHARTLVTRGAAPLLPLALGAPPGAAAESPGFFAATWRAGASALAALVLGAVALVLSLARVLSLAGVVRGARRLAPRVASLVQAGELGAAAAECRKVTNGAGRMLLAIVERARSYPGAIERVEERASEAFLDASLALGRGAVIANALLVLGCAGALLGTVAQARAAVSVEPLVAARMLEAFVPLERALLVGAPAALAALAAHALVRLGRHELERAMVRTVDAVAHSGREVA